MHTRSRRAAAVALTAALALSAAGCGTNFGAQTSAVYQAGVGTNNRSADVDVLNALFVKGTSGGATLSAGLVNQTLQLDRLTAVTVTTLAGTPVETTFDGPFAVPARRLVSLGQKPQAVITGDELFAGQFLDVTFTFRDAGEVRMQVPIVSRTSMYDGVAEPEGAASPSPSEATPSAE